MDRRRALAAAAAVSVFVLASAAADTVLRARSALQEAEVELAWADHPELKRAHCDAEFETRRAQIENERAAGALSSDAADKRLAVARFERDRELSDSSLRRACVWLDSAANLFAPPHSRWSERARALLVVTRERWRQERVAQGLPAEDWRLQ